MTPTPSLCCRLFPLLLLATASWLVTPVTAKAILGVDLGSLYMKVALVQRGAPLEIVTNLHSKRKTENMVLFDAGTRFYGADANSLYGRKSQKTPSSVSVFLGRDQDHPSVSVRILLSFFMLVLLLLFGTGLHTHTHTHTWTYQSAAAVCSVSDVPTWVIHGDDSCQT